MATKPKAGTAVATPKMQLPANVAEVRAQRIAAMKQQFAAPVAKGIKCEGKEFKFPNADETVTSFKAVIVRFVNYNAFYENPWKEGVNAPPNCFALGELPHEKLEASPNSPAPEHEKGAPACKGCWANEFGSADNGKGKRCSNTIKLALLCSDGEMRVLSLSATAITDFKKYSDFVVKAFNTDVAGVLTEFTFDDKVKWGSVRCGNPIRLNEDQDALAMSLYDEAGEMLLREPDVSEFEEKVVALRAKKPAGKGKAISRGARA